MYARGLSVRNIEDALPDATGDTLLWRTAVSELTEALWEDYQAFCERDLSAFAVEYLFIAVYEGLRQWGCSQGLLCAWAISRDGRKVLVHLTLGSRENHDKCLAFIRDMVRRGLRTPVWVTTDAALGLMSAVEQVWGSTLRQRCLGHKMRNILDKVSPAAREEIRRRGQDVFYAPSLEAARERAPKVLRDYHREHPVAMRGLNDDLEARLAYRRCPVAHHKTIRTTNLLKRGFQESR